MDVLPLDTYPADEYGKFLADIKSRYGDDFWNPLPFEMCGFAFGAAKERSPRLL